MTVHRYGTTATVQISEQVCLWYGAWRTDTVRLILVRDTDRKNSPAKGYGIALVTTDLDATAEDIIARYAARWSIEVTFFDAKNILGVGQARNRTTKAVERTVPFGLFCHSILILWYALHGHDQTAQRRALAPWYRSKTEPSTLDMLGKLRRQIIAARVVGDRPPIRHFLSASVVLDVHDPAVARQRGHRPAIDHAAGDDPGVRVGRLEDNVL